MAICRVSGPVITKTARHRKPQTKATGPSVQGAKKRNYKAPNAFNPCDSALDVIAYLLDILFISINDNQNLM